jgi:membrane protein DedA with SNARE-associated domain
MAIRLGAAAVVVALVALIATDVIPLPDLQEAVEDSGRSLGLWLYPFTAGMAFLEGWPPPSLLWPGEFEVIFAGAIAAQSDEIDIVPLIAIVWVASALSDSLGFALGRRYGRPLVLRVGSKIGFNHEKLDRLDGWFDRWGSATLVVGRLLPIARPLGPFVAGTSHMPYRRFLRWNLIGVTLFSVSFCLLGYLFYESYDELVVVIGRAGLGVALALIAVAVVVTRRRRRAAR